MTDRMQDAVALVARLAAGDAAARGKATHGDQYDVLIAELNGLAERHEAERSELFGRINDGVRELEQLNEDVVRLSEFGNLLQACENSAEAYDVIEHEVSLLFPGLAGALYLFNASRNVLELKASWGGLELDALFPRSHCWALRRGQRHLVLAETPRLSCRHTIERLGDSICFPMAAQGETLGMLHLMGRSLQHPGRKLLTPGKQRLGVTMAEQTALSLANLRMRDSLSQQAVRDPLTGLYNRRVVDDWAEREMIRAESRNSSVGLMMLDVDHFKRFNDVHGHDAGDAILAAISATVRDQIRSDDIACRYGGEELLVLAADMDGMRLQERAEHLRRAVSQTTVVHGGDTLPPVTVSVGLAMFPQHGRTLRDVLKVADAALYTAKQAGRDRVVFAPIAEAAPLDATS